MSDSLSVVFLEGTSSEFWPAVMQIRKDVFVDEQKIDISLEFDDTDAIAHHLLVLDNGHPAGVCRFFKTDEGYKMGRFAVAKSFRGQGIGNALIQASLGEIEEVAPKGTRVYLHAQTTVTGFYEEEGFVIKGVEFMEDGIAHVMMEQVL